MGMLSFEQIVAEKVPVSEVGGKGHALAHMVAVPGSAFPEARAGGPHAWSVPPGGVLSCEVYRRLVQPLVDQVVSASGAALDTAALASLREMITAIDMPDDVVADVAAFLGHLAAEMGVSDATELRVAVRSSGVAEDGAHSSFAGQYASILNVHAHARDVCDAVRRVWASQFNDHILSYLTHRVSGSASLPGMCVVVQAQVDAQAAGVAFTLHPSAAGRREAVVECVWGQGEGLVSGEITPTTFTVDWSDPCVCGVTDAAHTQQESMHVCNPEGELMLVETSDEQRSRPCIGLPEIRTLMRAALEIACVRGAPQDMEWCVAGGRLYVVQTRPITSFAFAPGIGKWEMILAGAPCILDETLVGDGFRRFLLNHYLPAARSLGQQEVVLWRDDVSSDAAGVPMRLKAHCPAVSLASDRLRDDEPLQTGLPWYPGMPTTYSCAAACTDATSSTFTSGCVWLARVSSPEHVEAAQRAAVAAAARVAVLIAPGKAVASLIPTCPVEELLPTLVIADGREVSELFPAGAASSAVAALRVDITDAPYRIVMGRVYCNSLVRAPARRCHYEVLDAAKLIANVMRNTEEFRAGLLQVLEHSCAKLVLHTMAAPTASAVPVLDAGELSYERILAFMKAYRDTTFDSWSIGFHAGNVETAFGGHCKELASQIQRAGVDIGNLLTGLTSHNALDALEAIAFKHSGNLYVRPLALRQDLSAQAFTDALMAPPPADVSADVTAHRTAFLQDLLDYLTHYGWMADNDEDFAATHWAESPALPLTVARNIIRSVSDDDAARASARLPTSTHGGLHLPPSPAMLHRASSTASADKYEVSVAMLREFVPKDHAVWQCLDELRTCMRLKEKVHVQYVRIGLQLKTMLLQWLQEAKRAHPGPFAGTPSESCWLYAPFAAWLPALAARSDDTLQHLRRHALPNYFERMMWQRTTWPYAVSASSGGSIEGADAELPAVSADAVLRGMACSAGLGGPVIGPARIIRSLDEASQLQRGDVLVTRITSPAWTPLFSLVRACVLEEGGMLSHGAVVARECGIPAVTRIEGAMRLIKSGDIIRVDGQAGTVTWV